MAGEKRTRVNGRASRAAILDAAFDLFAERGYRGASMNAIAERVGMSVPGLLHHFATKDELLIEVIRSHEDAQGERLRELLEGDLKLIERIVLLGALNEQKHAEQLLFSTLTAEAVPPGHPLHAFFVERYERYRNELAGAIKELQRRKEIKPRLDPHSLAAEIIATLDGLRLQWLLSPDRLGLAQATKAYARRLADEITLTKRR